MDANIGFYQIELGREATELTTFIMPFGRYFYKITEGNVVGPQKYDEMRRNVSNTGWYSRSIDDLCISIGS